MAAPWLRAILLRGCATRYSPVPMPTVLRIGPYRFYFYSHEPNEPPHIHVDRDDLSAKFWVDPVGLARNFGFRPRELADLEHMVQDNTATFLKAWHDYFGP
jgi:hypothetical protein